MNTENNELNKQTQCIVLEYFNIKLHLTWSVNKIISDIMLSTFSIVIALLHVIWFLFRLCYLRYIQTNHMPIEVLFPRIISDHLAKRPSDLSKIEFLQYFSNMFWRILNLIAKCKYIKKVDSLRISCKSNE